MWSKQAIKRTFVSVAEEVGIVGSTVQLVFKGLRGRSEQKIRFETPEVDGHDEIHLIKPRGVIAKHQNNTIVGTAAEPQQGDDDSFLSNLEGRHQVQYVAMDMWHPYKDAVEAVMPQAKVVIDKFHVVRMANDAMERSQEELP